MNLPKADLEKMEKWTLDSLGYIKDNNCDALLLGGFSGSVIELFGRYLRIHIAKKGERMPYIEWFGDFLRRYLPDYLPHKHILYRNLRCEGAHAILAESGVGLSCKKEDEVYHLKGVQDSHRKYLFIYAPKFIDDLIKAVKNFFSDIKKNPNLEKNCQKTYSEIWKYGQNIINKEQKSKRFKVDLRDT
jgi:hypothetical protein